MAAEVGTAFLTVMPSTKGFAANLGAQLGPGFVAAGRAGGRQIGDGVGAAGKSSFLASGRALAKTFAGAFAAVGVAQIATATFGFFANAVQSASGLEQAMGGVDAVFQDSADQIHAWAEEAADAVGLSKTQYSELATVLGAQLKNMGIPMEEVADQTGTLIGLGADLAAQFGGTTSDAVSALSSLLRGERDPIERYGVSINEARVQARLAEMGLGDLTGEAETNAKFMATLSLLTEQTADAQGAFGRESETLAGKQQRLQAQFENMTAEIGTALMPAISDLAGVFLEEGVPALQEMVAWFVENKDAIYDMLVAAVDMSLGVLEAFLAINEGAAQMQAYFYTVAALMVKTWFTVADQILAGAEIAFGWVPGAGDKITDLRGDLQRAGEVGSLALGVLGTESQNAANDFGAARDTVASLREKVRELDGSTAAIKVTVDDTLWRNWQPGSKQGSVTVTSPSAPTGAYGSNYGRRATGGTVDVGRPYVVGEREAEVFVPRTQGSIFNQRQLREAMQGGQAAPAAVYVQNPFTGEYLLAQVDHRAAGVVAADHRASASVRTTRGRVS